MSTAASGSEFVFPDTCLFMNFAAVARIDLLEKLIVERGAWTEAVRDEVADYANDLRFTDLARVLNFMPKEPHRPSGAELEVAVKIRKGFAKPGRRLRVTGPAL